MSHEEIKNAGQALAFLQFVQEEHDRIFHRDIYNLSPVHRVRHLKDHLTKYGSKLVLAEADRDPDKIRALLVDCFVITLSLANAFLFKISNHTISLMGPTQSLSDVIKSADPAKYYGIVDDIICVNMGVRELESTGNTSLDVLRRYFGLLGIFAKAVEARDHLEDHPYVKSIRVEFIPGFWALLVMLLKEHGIHQIEYYYLKRLKEIQTKHPFSENMMPMMRTYNHPYITWFDKGMAT